MNIIAKGYFYANWYGLTPAMIIFIVGMAFAGYKTIGEAYGDEEVYPAWTNNLGKISFLQAGV